MQLAPVGIHIASVVLAVFAVAELVAFLAFGHALERHLALGGAALQLSDFVFKVEEMLVALCGERAVL